jgi:ankyrin repeat protein
MIWIRVTPLHRAVAKNDAPVVRLLLACNARASIADSTGRTPLEIAQSNGNTEIRAILQNALLKEGADNQEQAHTGKKRTEEEAQMGPSSAKRTAKDAE